MASVGVACVMHVWRMCGALAVACGRQVRVLIAHVQPCACVCPPQLASAPANRVKQQEQQQAAPVPMAEGGEACGWGIWGGREGGV